jgi:predicted ATP-binding protein involved in virulence
MEVEKQGEILTVNQLSDGEKCLMAMIGDMARRMAIAKPFAG